MKGSKRFPVLAALCILGVTLMTAACVKDSPAASDDLQFAAESSIATKAIYGADAGEYQRIIWQGGDEVTIASDQAQTLWGRKFCDYIVTPENGDESASTRESKGRISRKPTIVDKTEDSGLRWNENASGTGNFWSVYPATTDNSIQNGNVKIAIPATTSPALSVNQPSGDIIKILDPVNGSYPMVAHATANANNALVKLQYYPAFTAFQITLLNNSGSQITLASCALSSTTSDLYGTFTASIDDLAKDNPQSPVLSNLTDAGKSVSVGIGQILADGKGITFSIFCLPQDLTNLTFSCTYVDESGEQTRKLQLKKDDAAITFGACKQHRMTLTLREDLNFDISLVMKIILANAFPDLFDMNWTTGSLELLYKGTLTPVSEADIRAAILQTKDVTITNDYGQQNLPYTAADMAAFKNLESFVIDHITTISDITIDGLPNFTTFDMIYADNIHNVTITNCPMTETVIINSQSLNTLDFENLAELKYLTINEGTANSNLETLTVKNCPDLEVADLGDVGALAEIDLSGCDQMTTLNVGLAYVLENLNLDGCSSLKTLYINKAQKLATLDVDDCTDIESIDITDAQALTSLIIHDKAHLESINVTSTQPHVEIVELVNLPALSELIFPSSQVSRCTITNCDALTSLNLPVADHLSTLELSDNDNLVSLILTDPTKLTEFTLDSPIIQELRLNGQQGSSALQALTLNLPSLTTFEFTNLSAMQRLTLSNLPASITSFGRFQPAPQYGNLKYISLTACNGFQSVEVNPSYSFKEMHFDSCSNLRSVTLVYCYTGDSNIIATKHNCPNLNYFTVNNGTPRNVPITEQ